MHNIIAFCSLAKHIYGRAETRLSIAGPAAPLLRLFLFGLFLLLFRLLRSARLGSPKCSNDRDCFAYYDHTHTHKSNALSRQQSHVSFLLDLSGVAGALIVRARTGPSVAAHTVRRVLLDLRQRLRIAKTVDAVSLVN